jgi:hypothetical protein
MTESTAGAHEDPTPDDNAENPDTVTVEETPEAKGAENVYFSMTFNNVPRAVAEQILEQAHKTAGATSFSVYYDTAQTEFAG